MRTILILLATMGFLHFAAAQTATVDGGAEASATVTFYDAEGTMLGTAGGDVDLAQAASLRIETAAGATFRYDVTTADAALEDIDVAFEGADADLLTVVAEVVARVEAGGTLDATAPTATDVGVDGDVDADVNADTDVGASVELETDDDSGAANRIVTTPAGVTITVQQEAEAQAATTTVAEAEAAEDARAESEAGAGAHAGAGAKGEGSADADVDGAVELDVRGD